MKRVLFVTENLFPLGSAQVLAERAINYSAQGIDVHIASFSDRHRNWLSDCPLTIHGLSPSPKKTTSNSIAEDRGFQSRRLWHRENIRMLFKLRHLINQLNPDRIVAWGQTAAWITQISEIGFSLQKHAAREWHYYEPMIPSAPSRFATWSWFGAPGFSTAIVPHETVGQALKANRFQAAISVAPHSIQPLELVPHLKVRNRDDGRSLLRATLGLPESAKIAGAVAPLVSRSRIKDLIWATDLLNVIRDDFHLAVFGCGWHYPGLKKFAGFTEAESRVHFLGEPDAAWAMFQGLDFFWHSHRYEPLPMNMINAMQFGIPVISVLAPGTEELIRHQETGFGVSFGSRDEFARWTKYLIEQPDQANQLIVQARQYIQKTFERPMSCQSSVFG